MNVKYFSQNLFFLVWKKNIIFFAKKKSVLLEFNIHRNKSAFREKKKIGNVFSGSSSK